MTNLLQGPAELWTGLFGVAEPATADAAPGVGWTNAGGTDGGARLVINQSYSNMTVDQVAGPVGSRLTDRAITVATSLAEAMLDNLRLALNDDGTGDTLEVDSEITNSEPNYRSIMLIGQKPGGGNRLIIVRRALSTESIEMSWTKDGKTMIPVTFSGYYVSNSVSSLKIDDSEA